MAKRGGMLLWVGGLTWLFLTGAGFLVLLNHAFEPARVTGSAPIEWPRSSALPRLGFLPRVVMFVHPHCPCTLAGLQELRAITRQKQPHPEVLVVVLHSDRLPADWSDTESVRLAARIPGASVFRDRDGTEAARFGAAASGHLMLYSPDGRLLYSGGITPSRGHSGDNAGSQSVLSCLHSGNTPVPAGPVFGCPLFAPAETPAKKGAQCCSS